MKTFKWQPMIEATSKRQYQAKIQSFGDGYEQRQKGSPHTDLRIYENMVFRGTREYVEQIANFVDEHAGVKAFLWHAHDRNQPRKYRTDGDPIVKFITGDAWEITLTMKEVLV